MRITAFTWPWFSCAFQRLVLVPSVLFSGIYFGLSLLGICTICLNNGTGSVKIQFAFKAALGPKSWFSWFQKTNITKVFSRNEERCKLYWYIPTEFLSARIPTLFIYRRKILFSDGRFCIKIVLWYLSCICFALHIYRRNISIQRLPSRILSCIQCT